VKAVTYMRMSLPGTLLTYLFRILLTQFGRNLRSENIGNVLEVSESKLFNKEVMFSYALTYLFQRITNVIVAILKLSFSRSLKQSMKLCNQRLVSNYGRIRRRNTKDTTKLRCVI